MQIPFTGINIEALELYMIIFDIAHESLTLSSPLYNYTVCCYVNGSSHYHMYTCTHNMYTLLSYYRSSRKFFDRKYFIDKKVQGKIFSLMHDFLEIFLPRTYIASDNIYAL